MRDLKRLLAVAGCVCATGCYTGKTEPGNADGSSGATAADATAGEESGSDTSSDPPPDPNDDPPNAGQEFECENDIQDPGPVLARRLNRAEVINSVNDVLGVDASDLTDQLPPDYRAEGFTNTAAALIVTTDDVEALANAAGEITTRIGDFAGFVSQYTSCTDFTAACQDEFIHGIGLKMYRRPITSEEVTSLSTVFAHAQSEGDTFTDGARSVVEAMLQAPPFLYRIEAQVDDGNTFRALDGYEVASRISYLVLGSPPDDELYAAAAAGALSTPEERIEHVRRIATRPAARATSLRYLGDWVHIQRVDHIGAPLPDDMREETESFFEYLVWDEARPLNELLNANYTFVSPELATAYGLEAPGPDGQVDITNVPERVGMLTQGAVLSWEDGTASMVQRGLFVLREVICGQISPPPPGVDDSPPAPEPGKSKRYYAQERIDTNPCGACHVQFDTIGFAFEHYDGFGVYQETDEHGNELRSDGVLSTPFHEDLEYENPQELADILAADDRVADCMLLKVAQFSLGRRLAVSDGCTLADIRTAIEDDGVGYQTLLETIVAQESFAQIRIEGGQ